MPVCGDFQAWLECHSSRLPEYRIRPSAMTLQNQKASTSCYVATTAGQPFSICVNDLREDKILDVEVQVFFDGILTASVILDEFAKIDSCLTDIGTESLFVFGVPQVTDDDDVADNNQTRLNDLGTIRLSFEFVEVVERAEPRVLDDSTATVGPLPPVHEKLKMSGTHNAQLGPSVPSNPDTIYQVVEPLEGFPIYEMIFSCAPEDRLLAQGIIKRQPHSTGTKRRNNSIDNADNALPHKKRAPMARSGASRKEEVIDLTGDSD
ncbi:hypothetical protein SISSUDRAFT_381069 [Sistotremastrum suecicum HHB10207 ss-3]|uniref:DUF7918 domain-containing protein n=1 Tax=Sistotremastrum suecicum HHB10207 ss-3 TaxID=1314776 RepID=A0A165YYT2_9AGAM|nr:hypothetical protein SISSUDRAFT_381069 [Sistotremastrum suecicum HHB10207 ss-3]